MLTLRPYQEAAAAQTTQALAAGKHPVISLPCGSGKSLVIAALAAQLPGRVLVLTHRRELLEQNATQLIRQDAQADFGFYSAGLKQRETRSRVIFAGIQSVYKRMETLQAVGPFDYVLIDEAHTVTPRNAGDTMYTKALLACPRAQRIGLSATPWRTEDGPLWEAPTSWFDTLAMHVTIRELTPQYLAPLRGLLTAHSVPLDGVRLRQGEYVTADLSQVVCNETLVRGALDELCTLGRDRKSWAVFATDVAHTTMLTEALQQRGIHTRMVVGTTPSDERTETLQHFKEGSIQALVSCDVISVGFDAPNIDLLALLRPTQSKIVCIQQLGRGCRQYPGKDDALILDFSENLWRHKPLDGIPALGSTPEREAKAAQAAERQARVPRERALKHGAEASLTDPFGEEEPPAALPVDFVVYDVQPSKKHPGKQNLVALFKVRHPLKWVRSYVALEYPGGAAWHARQWFARRGLVMPSTAHEAKALLERTKRTSTPAALVVRMNGKYPEIMVEHFRESCP